MQQISSGRKDQYREKILQVLNSTHLVTTIQDFQDATITLVGFHPNISIGERSALMQFCKGVNLYSNEDLDSFERRVNSVDGLAMVGGGGKKWTQTSTEVTCQDLSKIVSLGPVIFTILSEINGVNVENSQRAITSVESFIEVFWKDKGTDAELKGVIKLFDLLEGDNGTLTLRVKFFESSFSHWAWRAVFIRGERTRMTHREVEYLFDVDRVKLQTHGNNIQQISNASGSPNNFDLDAYLALLKQKH